MKYRITVTLSREITVHASSAHQAYGMVNDSVFTMASDTFNVCDADVIISNPVPVKEIAASIMPTAKKKIGIENDGYIVAPREEKINGCKGPS